jgi:hypothetical protein
MCLTVNVEVILVYRFVSIFGKNGNEWVIRVVVFVFIVFIVPIFIGNVGVVFLVVWQ